MFPVPVTATEAWSTIDLTQCLRVREVPFHSFLQCLSFNHIFGHCGMKCQFSFRISIFVNAGLIWLLARYSEMKHSADKLIKFWEFGRTFLRSKYVHNVRTHATDWNALSPLVFSLVQGTANKFSVFNRKLLSILCFVCKCKTFALSYFFQLSRQEKHNLVHFVFHL